MAYQSRATADAPAWRLLGPAGSGGRVAAVAGTDRDPLLYYFGAAGGGVFKTTDGGLTWHDVWTGDAVGAIGAIAIAPSDPRTVWVGTGESTPRNDASVGDGVWLTHDGGVHWKHVGLNETDAIARIVVDPRNANIALVGALGNPYRDSSARGVYRTADGGATWTKTLFPGPATGISDLSASRDGHVVYAGAYYFRRKPWTFISGGPNDQLFKSNDGGLSWHPLRAGGLPPGTVGRIGLAVAPSDAQRIYALIQSRAGLLWRSDDGGAHWRMMSRDTLIDQRPFYMSRLDVDPSNRDHVFFASENLIETGDGGKTFHDDSSAVHQDHHGFWISHDGRRMIEADDGGAPISVDGGVTWDWRFNVTLAQVYHVGFDHQIPYHVCAAMQDDDSFCAANLSLSPLGLQNADWRDVANDADGVWAWPDPQDPNLVWNVGVNELNGQLGIFDLTSRQNVDVSPDVTDTNGRALAGLPYRFNWEAPVAFSAKEPGVTYFGGNVVFETSDRGRTWRAISPDLTRNDPGKQQRAGGAVDADVSGAEFYDTLLDIAPSPVDSNVIWAGSDDGIISRTTDHGAHWSSVAPSWIGAWGRIDCVEPSSASVDRAYAVVDRHLLGDPRPYVMGTNDGGVSWQLLTAGLPSDETARVVREDPKNPDVLYAGTERGAWYSRDRGMHWQPLRMNLPPVAVYDMRVQPDAGDLIAGTHGRGVYILDDLSAFEAPSPANAPTLFPIRPAFAWYEWWTTGYGVDDTECCTAAGSFSAADPSLGALLTLSVPRASRGHAAVEVDDQRGKRVRTFDVAIDSGLNRFAWNLTAQPPTPWTRARDWNRGPSDGPTVVPGTYEIHVRFAGADLVQSVDVRPDPRARWSIDDLQKRFAFLQRLDDDLSTVDEALNHLDRELSHAHPSERAIVAPIYTALTSGVVNSEDDEAFADRIRERITTLQGVVALSQAPPLPPHEHEAQAIEEELSRVMDRYHALIQEHRIP